MEKVSEFFTSLVAIIRALPAKDRWPYIYLPVVMLLANIWTQQWAGVGASICWLLAGVRIAVEMVGSRAHEAFDQMLFAHGAVLGFLDEEGSLYLVPQTVRKVEDNECDE